MANLKRKVAAAIEAAEDLSAVDVFPEGTGGAEGTACNDAVSSGSPEISAGGAGGADAETMHLPKPEILRPSYVVREAFEAVDGRTWKPGVWWHNTKEVRGEVVNVDTWLCGPLYVDAITSGEGGHGFGRLLRFRDSFGKWHEWAMPMEMLRGSGEELRGELLAAGLEMDVKQAREQLPAYLQWRVPKTKALAITRTGWTTEKNAFVLPDTVIGGRDYRVIFQSEQAHQDAAASQRGTLTAWQTNVAAKCEGNPVLAVSVSVALAGPLLALIQGESGGIHWVGHSSTGKTTALHVGASCWGGETFRRTWRATGNGLEGVAALVNDTCLCLDEINEADPREIGGIIYSLGNGTGKTRASRIGSARNAYRWRVTLLSTGERTVAAQMAEGGKTPKAGQLVRLLNIPAARTNGAFDELHGAPSGQAFADSLKTACAIDYGWAGPLFIYHLIEAIAQGRDFGAELAAMKALEAFQTTESQAARVAARFALYALAGELAIEFGVIPWQPTQAIASAVAMFEAWKSANGTGNNENRAILQAVGDYINRYGDTRFTRRDDKEAKVTGGSRSGWWDDRRDGRIFLFNSGALKEAALGFDLPTVLAALDGAGWIAERDEGKRSKNTRVNGTNTRLYWIRPCEVEP